MRLIARLDIKGPNVVKTVRTEGLRVVGNPTDLAKKYYDAGIDELVYMDIVASLYERNLDFELLKNVSQELFIPLTVGGGIRSVHDVAQALKSGADKVAINTYATHHPEFITEAAETFGAQCIVLSVEAKRMPGGGYEALTDGGREHTHIDAIDWIKRGVELGAGEILLTSVDADGTRTGYDLDLIRTVAAFAPVPVIAHGGGGKPEDLLAAAKAGADAVCASSLYHYDLASVSAVKKLFTEDGVAVRP